jgi:Holliday junction resolvase RusA-like endonuclease
VQHPEGSYKLSFPIVPRPKERARVSFRGGKARAYTPSKTRNFEAEIRLLAREEFGESPLECPLNVCFYFYMPRPKSVRRKNHTVKPDLSNLVKAVEDACNGIIWKDDSQIIIMSAHKIYSPVPRIEMIVSKISE